MLVINLFGAPGSGKSTGAAYIFSLLKMNGVNAELVTEFAKDKVWEGNTEALRNQAYVFGEQYYRLSRCAGKVDVVVTDSPILFSIIYKDSSIFDKEFDDVVLKTFSSYESKNYLIKRVKEYNPSGRLQKQEESDAIDQKIQNLLDYHGIPYKKVNGDKIGYEYIFDEIMLEITKEKE